MITSVKYNQTEISDIYNHFCDNLQSVHIATADTNGHPNCSYAPFIQDENKNIYIYISSMAKHYHNLISTGKASLMFIEDESKSTKIFARRRLTYNCTTSKLAKTGDEFKLLANMFENKFGSQVKIYHTMGDFDVFKLEPIDGLLVVGFGQAYTINVPKSVTGVSVVHQVMHVSQGGHQKGNGHQFKDKSEK